MVNRGGGRYFLMIFQSPCYNMIVGTPKYSA